MDRLNLVASLLYLTSPYGYSNTGVLLCGADFEFVGLGDWRSFFIRTVFVQYGLVLMVWYELMLISVCIMDSYKQGMNHDTIDDVRYKNKPHFPPLYLQYCTLPKTPKFKNTSPSHLSHK